VKTVAAPSRRIRFTRCLRFLSEIAPGARLANRKLWFQYSPAAIREKRTLVMGCGSGARRQKAIGKPSASSAIALTLYFVYFVAKKKQRDRLTTPYTNFAVVNMSGRGGTRRK